MKVQKICPRSTEVLETYESVNDVCDKNPDYNKDSLLRALNKCRLTYAGFVWRYETEIVIKKSQNVPSFDDEGKFCGDVNLFYLIPESDDQYVCPLGYITNKNGAKLMVGTSDAGVLMVKFLRASKGAASKALRKIIAEMFVKNPNGHNYVDNVDQTKYQCDYRNIVWAKQSRKENAASFAEELRLIPDVVEQTKCKKMCEQKAESSKKQLSVIKTAIEKGLPKYYASGEIPVIKEISREECVVVEGLEFYQIPNLPRNKVSRCGKVLGSQGKIMSTRIRQDGYEEVELSTGISAKRTKYLVHRLVAETFIVNVHECKEVNHIDGNKSNNVLENLEWCTSSQNKLHALTLENKMVQSKAVVKYSANWTKLEKYDSQLEAAQKNPGCTNYGISKSCVSAEKSSPMKHKGYFWKYANKEDYKAVDLPLGDWTPIKGWSGYVVSKTGSVYSTKTKVELTWVQKGGYPTVHLRNGKGGGASVYVHVLVAQTYIPNDNLLKTQVNHIDGNKQNASVENLEWCTPKENTVHAVKTGLLKQPKNRKAVVQYSKDRVEIARFESVRAAFQQTGASEDTIPMVCNGKRKASGGYIWKWASDVAP